MTSESSFFHGVPPDDPRPDAEGFVAEFKLTGQGVTMVRRDDTVYVMGRLEIKKEHAPSAPDAEGWIEWHGGECPVDRERVESVRLRDGVEGDVTGWWVWNPQTPGKDIVAYRLHPPAKPKRQVWVNVYDGGLAHTFPTEQKADDYNRCMLRCRIACVPLDWPDDAPWPWGE
jgi:hypothetical protein